MQTRIRHFTAVLQRARALLPAVFLSHRGARMPGFPRRTEVCSLIISGKNSENSGIAPRQACASSGERTRLWRNTKSAMMTVLARPKAMPAAKAAA